MITLADLPERALKRRRKGGRGPRAIYPSEDDGINLTKELEHYETVLGKCYSKANGITSRAAQLLQVNRTTLVEKLKRKGFDPHPSHARFKLTNLRPLPCHFLTASSFLPLVFLTPLSVFRLGSPKSSSDAVSYRTP